MSRQAARQRAIRAVEDSPYTKTLRTEREKPFFTQEEERTPQSPSEPSGEELRDSALEGLRSAHEEELVAVRGYLRMLWRGNGHTPVSADDARGYVVSRGWKTGPWMGSIFTNGRWEKCGYVKSKWPGNHARPVQTWRPK